MSEASPYSRRMKNRIKEHMEEQEELIAVFGDARLVRVNDRVHLRGGSMADRTEALEWIAMNLPDTVAGLRR